MQEWKIGYVDQREIPVLISDEKEALLAAKAAGRAIIGLWRPDQAMDEIAAARYVVEDAADATPEYLERVARRHLGLPWNICETERLLLREMCACDFAEVWENQIGLGFGSLEELKAYTENQYSFYEFGFWALVEKSSGKLAGVAGLKVPEELEETDREMTDVLTRNLTGTGVADDSGEILELGYHVFSSYRKKGYASEACQAVLDYAAKELGIAGFMVRIDKKNIVSRHLAECLGFFAGN